MFKKIVSMVVTCAFIFTNTAYAAPGGRYKADALRGISLGNVASLAAPAMQDIVGALNSGELPFALTKKDYVKFGTSGWRWEESDYEVNGKFNEDVFLNDLRAALSACAEQIKEQQRINPGREGVVIGSDTRATGPFDNKELVKIASEFLASKGLIVYVINDYTPVPSISNMISNLKAAGSVYFTASHNPGKGYKIDPDDPNSRTTNYNGLKFNPADSGPAPAEITDLINSQAQALRKSLIEVEFDKAKHKRNIRVVESTYAISAYIVALSEVVDLEIIEKAFFNGTIDYIVADAAGGSTTKYYRAIFSHLGLVEGVDYEILNAEPDSSFTQLVDPKNNIKRPDRPEPAEKYSAHLIHRINELRESGKKVIGVKADPDGDRNGIVDISSAFLDPNTTLAIEAQYVLQQAFIKWVGENYPDNKIKFNNFIDDAATRNLPEYKKLVEKFVTANNIGIGKTIPTSNILNAIAKIWGCRLEEVQVGFKWFRPHLRYPDSPKSLEGESFDNDRPCIIVGEESQGLVLRGKDRYKVLEKDALLAGLKMVETVAKTGMMPQDLYAYLQKNVGYFAYNRGGVDLLAMTTKDKVDELKAELKAKFDALKEGIEEGDITELDGKAIKEGIFKDGYKIVFEDDSWFGIRFSGTEPVVRLYTEAVARNIEAAEEIREQNHAIGEKLLLLENANAAPEAATEAMAESLPAAQTRKEITQEAETMLEQIQQYMGLPIKTKAAELNYLTGKNGLFENWDDVFIYFASLEFEESVYQVRDVKLSDEEGTRVFAYFTNEEGMAHEAPSVENVRAGMRIADNVMPTKVVRARKDDETPKDGLKKGEVRFVSELSVAMIDETAVEQTSQDKSPVYFMQRGVFKGPKHITLAFEYPNKQRFDITIMRPGTYGKDNELVHTSGHFHLPKKMPEIYQVVYGRAAYTLQKTREDLETPEVVNPNDIEKAIIIEAEAGEPVVILPGYGHVTTNLDPNRPLIMVNWLTWDQESQYGAFKRGKKDKNGNVGVGGACWYAVIENGQVAYKPNPNLGPNEGQYHNIPTLELARPASSVPQLGLKAGEPIYNIVNDPEAFNRLARYLNDPLSDEFKDVTSANVFRIIKQITLADAAGVRRSQHGGSRRRSSFPTGNNWSGRTGESEDVLPKWIPGEEGKEGPGHADIYGEAARAFFRAKEGWMELNALLAAKSEPDSEGVKRAVAEVEGDLTAVIEGDSDRGVQIGLQEIIDEGMVTVDKRKEVLGVLWNAKHRLSDLQSIIRAGGRLTKDKTKSALILPAGPVIDAQLVMSTEELTRIKESLGFDEITFSNDITGTVSQLVENEKFEKKNIIAFAFDGPGHNVAIEALGKKNVFFMEQMRELQYMPFSKLAVLAKIRLMLNNTEPRKQGPYENALILIWEKLTGVKLTNNAADELINKPDPAKFIIKLLHAPERVFSDNELENLHKAAAESWA